MDKYYGNVCELDIIFNFQKAYFILDELLLAGEMQESSKKHVLRCISQQDSLEDMEVRGRKSLGPVREGLDFHTLSLLCLLFSPYNLSSVLLQISMTDKKFSLIRSRMMALPKSCDSCEFLGVHMCLRS